MYTHLHMILSTFNLAWKNL